MIAKRVYYNGKEIYNRDRQGKFSSFKTGLVKFVKRLVIVCMVVGIASGVVYGSFMLGGKFNPVISYAERVVDTSPMMFAEKIATLKNKVADTLMSCESGGLKETDGIIVFDSNKRASIGQFQFQVVTVQYYYKTLYNKVITPKEAITIALDSNLARSLAIDVMFNTKNKASKDWYNCERRHGLDSQITIINQLTK